jgi:hypothetical protein
MKKIIFVFVLLFLLPHLAGTQSVPESRRTEEEKRDSLKPTEVQISPPQHKPELDQESAEMQFLTGLYSKKVAQFSDAVKITTILLRTYDPKGDFIFEVAALREKQIISRSISEGLAADAWLSKGTVAYMFCQALGIKGGVWMRLFGVSQRYCLRELVFAGIMQARGVNELVSGAELVDMFIKAVDYLAQDKTQVSAK